MKQKGNRKVWLARLLALLWLSVLGCCITTYAFSVRDLQRRSERRAFISSRVSSARSAVRPGMEDMFDSNAEKIVGLTDQLYMGYGRVANLASVSLMLSLFGLVLHLFYVRKKASASCGSE